MAMQKNFIRPVAATIEQLEMMHKRFSQSKDARQVQMADRIAKRIEVLKAPAASAPAAAASAPDAATVRGGSAPARNIKRQLPKK